MIRLMLLYALLMPARAFAAESLARMTPLSGAHSGAGSLRMSSGVGDVLVGPSIGGATVAWHGFYAPGMSTRTDVDGSVQAFDVLTGQDLGGRGLYLGRVSPNPARNSAAIEFGNTAPEEIDLSVYDVGGRCVRTLHRGAHAAGISRIVWNLASDARRSVPPGVYFVRLSGSSSSRTGRMVILR